MKVFVQYPVNATAVVEVEVPDDASYDDIVSSISRDDLVDAEISEVGWDQLKDAWRCEDHPDVYKSGDDGTIDWSSQVHDD